MKHKVEIKHEIHKKRLQNAQVYAVTAPSGTGKTTLCRRLIEEHPEVALKISLTTRPMRPGEQDGDHYHFISQSEFEAAIAHDELLEWANVFGNLYGTSITEIERITGLGKKALVEIDVQGYEQLKTRLTLKAAIFIMPPSLKILWERLEGRGTDSFATRLKRIRTAKDELAAASDYSHFIINHDLDAAYGELTDIIVHHKPSSISHERGLAHAQALINEFDHSPFFQKINDINAAGSGVE